MINIAKGMIEISMDNPEKVCQGSSWSHHDFSLCVSSPIGTTLVFSNASFKVEDGKSSFDFAIWFNGFWVHAISLDEPKVFLSKWSKD